MIAALQVSLDGLIEGPDGEKDWADSWASALQLVPDVDTFVLGGHMYPDYGEYWKSIDANPDGVPPFQDTVPSRDEVAYARFAATTPHLVLSTTLTSVSWPPTARIVRDVEELRALKHQRGKNMYVVGGAAIVTSLLNADLLDEVRLIVHPVLLGSGKALFHGAKRRSLQFVGAESSEPGRVVLTYRI